MKKTFFNLNRKLFATNYSTLFKYSDPSNPKVFFKVAKNNSEMGRLVFELYKNKCPLTVGNFHKICTGNNDHKLTYKNTSFTRITNGFAAHGGGQILNIIGEEPSCYGGFFYDENLNLKHIKRGTLTMDNHGSDTNSSRFMITFDETPWLDGYHVVIGELVEGDDILKEIENNGSRDGSPKAEIKIIDCGDLL